jgi:hypothetical protein
MPWFACKACEMSSLRECGFILPLRLTLDTLILSRPLEEQYISAICHDDLAGLAERLVRSCGRAE